MSNYIKTLKIVFIIMLISPLLISGIYFLSVEEGTIMQNDSIDEILIYLVPIMGVIFITIGLILFSKRLQVIKEYDNETQKLQPYKGIVIMRIALIEGVAVFSSVAFMITLNNIYIGYTIMAMAFFLPFYPTKKRIERDLRLDTESVNDSDTEPPKNILNKNQWIIIPFIILMILLNYNSLKDYFSNKVVVTTKQIDVGTITDSIYHNEYLGWSMVVPTGYNIIPTSKIAEDAKRGRKMLNEGNSKEINPIRLLDITNTTISLKSSLAPREMYPNLIDENYYIEELEEMVEESGNNGVTFEKINQGILQIDSIDFNYLQYKLTQGSTERGLFFMTKFDDDYIFELTISWVDNDKAVALFKNLNQSEFDWN